MEFLFTTSESRSGARSGARVLDSKCKLRVLENTGHKHIQSIMP